jgi:hypothetical protein
MTSLFKKKEVNIQETQYEIEKLNIRAELAKGDRIVANYKNLPYYEVNERYISMLKDRIIELQKLLPHSFIQNK